VSELSWWFAPHPNWEPTEDWPEEVPVVRYETDDEVALIDPFLPRDVSFDPHGKPVRVLLTQGAHYRLLPSLDALADLPIERVIIPHGDLILSDGAVRIRAAVAEARRG
jgi:hypothetical protein